MKKLNALNMKSFRQVEGLGFAQQVVRIIKEVYPEPTPPMARFAQEVQRMEELLVKDHTTVTGAHVREADKATDKCLSAIRNYLIGFKGHFDSDKAHAAERLWVVYADHSSLRRQGYKIQYAEIGVMVEEFLQVDSALRDLIDFTPWVTRLADLRQNFLKLQGIAVTHESQNSTADVKLQYETLANAYVELKEKINAMATLNDCEEIRTLIDHLNIIIDQAKRQLKARKTTSASKSSPPTKIDEEPMKSSIVQVREDVPPYGESGHASEEPQDSEEDSP